MTPEIKQRIDQIKKGEVPKGYQKTRFGIVPQEWDIHALRDYLKESRITGSNGAIARKITVKLWGRGVYEKREIHIGSENTTYYRRKKGQLIYSKLDFLNCAFGIIPDELDGFESTLDLPSFDIKRNINEYYLLSFIKQRSFYIRFGMIADGGRKARRISPLDMLSFPFLQPSYNEQVKIAEILSTQDKLIELKEKRIAEKQRQKKYLMQQLLTGERRLPGFNKDWVKGKISNYVELITDNINPDLYAQELFEVYSLPSFDDNRTPEILKGCAMNSGKFLISSGMLLFNKLNVRQKRVWLIKKESAYRLLSSTEFLPLILHDINSKFLMNYLSSDAVTIHFIKKSSGTSNSQQRILPDDLLKHGFSVPPIEEQTAIAEVLSTADREIELLQKELDTEKQKKKALMQLLLTGIVRVKI